LPSRQLRCQPSLGSATITQRYRLWEFAARDGLGNRRSLQPDQRLNIMKTQQAVGLLYL
jgi:hypothetical protein